jgi:hypothetical protein
MQELTFTLREFFLDELPGLIVPVSILIIGWIAAGVLAALVRRWLRRTELDDKLVRRVFGDERGATIDAARWAGRAVYWSALVLVAIAFFESLQLTGATSAARSLASQLLGFLPSLVGAAAVGLVAWLFATLTRRLIHAGLKRWSFDARVDAVLVDGEREDGFKIAESISQMSYWIVLLLFVPALLGVLGIEGLLGPVQGMVDQLLGFLPNLFSAALILLVGWFAARVISHVVIHVLDSAQTDRLAARIGLDEARVGRSLPGIIGLAVYSLVLIPVAVATLNALRLESVTAPASQMLERFFAAIPALVGAVLIIGIGYAAARLLSTFVENLVAGVGLDRVAARLGLPADGVERFPAAKVSGAIVMVAVLFFVAMEAARFLGFTRVSEIAAELTVVGGHLLFGVLIIGLSLMLSSFAARRIGRASLRYARTLAIASRVSILGFGGAIALRQMGVADEIIEIGFAAVLGSAAVAFALAFGLGGRAFAAEVLGDLRDRVQEREVYPEEATAAAAE